MNAKYITPIKTRVAGFLFSIVMSTAVLGATLLTMQAGVAADSPQLVAFDRVVITATALN